MKEMARFKSMFWLENSDFQGQLEQETLPNKPPFLGVSMLNFQGCNNLEMFFCVFFFGGKGGARMVRE